MTESEVLEDIVGSLESIETFGIEPDFSSHGLEPVEVLGFQTEEELDYAELHEALYYFSENPINLNKTSKEAPGGQSINNLTDDVAILSLGKKN